MKQLQSLPPPVVVGLGLFAYADFFGMTGLALVPLCGAMFGIGYGVTLPCCVEWSTLVYPRNRRPVALVNASFQIGSIIALRLRARCRARSVGRAYSRCSGR
jgi:hypothetical protein